MADEPDSSRRDFFRGTPALRKFRKAIGEAQDTLSKGVAADSAGRTEDVRATVPDPDFESRHEAYLETYTARAMACEFELLFNLHQYRNSGSAALLALEMLEDLEDRMSIYRDHSEFSRANRAAFAERFTLSGDLFSMLSTAKEIFHLTRGAFDVTSGPLSALWGFDRRQGELPESHAIEQALMNVGSELFELSAEDLSVRFSVPGLRLNPGGIGKGFALDRMADVFTGKEIGDFVIHGGQSSVLARGSAEPDVAEAGWKIGLTHPTIPGIRLGEYRLRNKALGTSGTARQAFFHKGKRYGHIIDPRTGWPTDHTLSSTVISDSAATADALATAFFVMSHEEVAGFCAQHPDISAILAVPEKDTGRISLMKFNVPDGDWISAGDRG